MLSLKPAAHALKKTGSHKSARDDHDYAKRTSTEGALSKER